MSIDSSLALSERHEMRTSVAGRDVLDWPDVAATGPRAWGVGALPAGSAVLVLERGPDAGSRFLLERDTTVVGRSGSDIALEAVTVSRRHAEFRRDGPSFVVVDVGSFNGTYVNRRPVDSAVLGEGDEVQIGKFRLIFHLGPPGVGPGGDGTHVASTSSTAQASGATGGDR